MVLKYFNHLEYKLTNIWINMYVFCFSIAFWRMIQATASPYLAHINPRYHQHLDRINDSQLSTAHHRTFYRAIPVRCLRILASEMITVNTSTLLLDSCSQKTKKTRKRKWIGQHALRCTYD